MVIIVAGGVGGDGRPGCSGSSSSTAAAALSSMVVVVAGAGAWSSRSRIGCNMVRLEEYEPTVNCSVHQAPKGTPKASTSRA